MVIPCYNEAKVLGRTLDHLLPHCATSRLELVVSDDGSADESLEIARRDDHTLLDCILITDELDLDQKSLPHVIP